MASLPTASKGKLGYSRVEVDLLLARARDQYSSPASNVLDWRDLTRQVFSLEKNGYLPSAVDSALEKLQDTFADRDTSLIVGSANALKESLAAKTERRKSRKFQRSGVMGFGYSRSQVDALVTIVGEYLSGREELLISEVRELTFKQQRGGYIESQVDAYIDRLVEYIQTQRFAKPVTPTFTRPLNVVDGSDFRANPSNETY